MGEQKRITVEEVKSAYRKTGMKPQRRAFYTREFAGPPCGCALGAIAVASGLDPENDSFRLWAISEYGDNYRIGFEAGFDCDPMPKMIGKVGYVGYCDGRDAAAAVLSESV